MNTVPTWHALLAELASAPMDPVTTPPRQSFGWLWALWLIPTGMMFVPVFLSVSGQKLPRAITDAFPWIVVPILLVSGVIVGIMGSRAVRAYNADLALFGLGELRPASWLARLGNTSQFSGRRWGRAVWISVDMPSKPAGAIGASIVNIGAQVLSFELVGQGVQLFAKAGPSAPVLAALATICPTGPWDGVTVTAGPDGITVRRAASWALRNHVERERQWLHDLWLAEHLAAALSAHR